MSRKQPGKFGVYKITNLINQKGYVGITRNLRCRWQEHQRDSLKDDKPLYRAMRKYGIEKFKFEILCLPPVEDPEIFFELEIFFIADQNTYIEDGWGYNLNRGGGGNIFPSQITIAKMSTVRKEWNAIHGANFKGHQHTDEWKEKMSLKMKGNIYSLGRRHTGEARKKMSDAKKGGKGTVTNKKAYILNGKVKFFLENPGYPWEKYHPVENNALRVTCLENNTVYDSCSDAARFLGINRGCVNACCKGINKKAKDKKGNIYHLSYAD
jgi:group I intron endonuclease